MIIFDFTSEMKEIESEFIFRFERRMISVMDSFFLMFRSIGFVSDKHSQRTSGRKIYLLDNRIYLTV